MARYYKIIFYCLFITSTSSPSIASFTASSSVMIGSDLLFNFYNNVRIQYDIDNLSNNIIGSKFDRALAKHYIYYAEEKYHNLDWDNANLFIRKARRILDGQIVEPENIKKTYLRLENRELAYAKRSELMIILSRLWNPMKEDGDLISKYSDLLAMTQFNFDCWVTSNQNLKITANELECKANFIYGIDNLKKYFYMPRVYKFASSIKLPTITAIKYDIKKQELYPFNVKFEKNELYIKKYNLQILDNIMEVITDHHLQNYQVTIIDRSYDNVSSKRMRILRKNLINKGVKEQSIAIDNIINNDADLLIELTIIPFSTNN